MKCFDITDVRLFLDFKHRDASNRFVYNDIRVFSPFVGDLMSAFEGDLSN